MTRAGWRGDLQAVEIGRGSKTTNEARARFENTFDCLVIDSIACLRVPLLGAWRAGDKGL